MKYSTFLWNIHRQLVQKDANENGAVNPVLVMGSLKAIVPPVCPICSRSFREQFFCVNSAVGIAIGYWLGDRGFGVRVPVGQEFSLLQIVKTGTGANPTSYPMGTGALSPRVKRPGREADYSFPASAEVKKIWNYTSTPPYAFIA
jgi:hypothetical protein